MWLKQQKFIFLQFWRLEVQDQGVGKFGFFCGLSSWLSDGHLLTVSSHDLFSVLVERERERSLVCLFLFSWGHQFYWIRASPLWPHLTLINPHPPPKALPQVQSHWKLEFQCINLGGQNSLHNRVLTVHSQVKVEVPATRGTSDVLPTVFVKQSESLKSKDLPMC